MYKVTLLKTAHIDCAESVLYKGGDPNIASTIGCHAFLLQKDDEYYLIDTGIESVDEANKTKSSKADWARFEDEYSIKENLDKLGVDCGQITKVFLTHSHYDHISGVVHFKNASFYMTRDEYNLFLNDTSVHREVNTPAREFLADKRIILVDNEVQINDIKLKKKSLLCFMDNLNEGDFYIDEVYEENIRYVLLNKRKYLINDFNDRVIMTFMFKNKMISLEEALELEKNI